jgi:hypothetical protein
LKLLPVAAAFITSSIFAIYTASGKARGSAHCLGNKAICAHYTCDLMWDASLTTLWLLIFLMAAGFLGTVNGYISNGNVHWTADLPAVLQEYNKKQSESPFTSSRSSSSAETSTDVQMMLVRGRSLLIVALVFSLIQLGCFVVTAVLSFGLRKALKLQSKDGALPITSNVCHPGATGAPVCRTDDVAAAGRYVYTLDESATVTVRVPPAGKATGKKGVPVEPEAPMSDVCLSEDSVAVEKC